MNCGEVMTVLSQCKLGAVVVDADSTILAVNDEGDSLLHGEGALIGKSLMDLAAPLCDRTGRKLYAHVAFWEYLLRCPAPTVNDLPDGAELIVFRQANNDACHDLLLDAFNRMEEAIILFDADERIYQLNTAAEKLDSLMTRDVIGKNVKDVYKMLDGSEMAVPRVIRTRQPLLNLRQFYGTCNGKEIDVVSDTYPVVQNGQVLGAFNILKDWSAIDNLHKQIIDLQQKLMVQKLSGKSSTKSALSARYRFSDIVHSSPVMHDLIDQCKRVAGYDSSIMIYGETGTGKELLAQSIHNASQRADGPFLAINCAALPENLLEGILFGTEKGAYTGAENRAGLFEQANGGTLLLDEINSMNISLQAKLLRVLQDGMVRRVGGMTETHIDVRVLSNINIPPNQAIEEHKLRLDLFYRLGVVNIHIPPLRERKEDISLLAKQFILQLDKKLRKNVRDIDEETLRRFREYDWPGNVRELQHTIEHAMNVIPNDMSVITPEYIPWYVMTTAARPKETVYSEAMSSLDGTMQDIERRTICKALRESGGNISEAARNLNMSRQNLQYRIKRHKIDIPTLLRQE